MAGPITLETVTRCFKVYGNCVDRCTLYWWCKANRISKGKVRAAIKRLDAIYVRDSLDEKTWFVLPSLGRPWCDDWYSLERCYGHEEWFRRRFELL